MEERQQVAAELVTKRTVRVRPRAHRGGARRISEETAQQETAEEVSRPEVISRKRSSLKMSRGNFADFKEGVLGRMENKARATVKADIPLFRPGPGSTDKQTESTSALPPTNAPSSVEFGQGPGVPDADFELVPVSAAGPSRPAAQGRRRPPGRRIQEIKDPAVAKKLSRFSTAPVVQRRTLSRSRGRGARPSTLAPEGGVAVTEKVDVEEEADEKKEVPVRARVRRPPSLREVARHRLRGAARPRPQARPSHTPTNIRHQRVRFRARPVVREEEEEEVGEEVGGEEEPLEREKTTPSPRRVRPRPGVGRRGRPRPEPTAGSSTARPRPGRGRRPVGRTSTSATTLGPSPTNVPTTAASKPTVSVTTATTSTTTEKITIDPEAHRISYTLAEDVVEVEESPEPVIVELELPDYLELEPGAEAATLPAAERLRSSVPLPGDVFSQATHQLMRSQGRPKGLGQPGFRPTLLPRRAPGARDAVSATDPPGTSFTEVTREAETSQPERATSPPAPPKRGRFILAIGANG